VAAGQNKTPSERLESLERWSGWATLLILAGIVLEIGNLFWFPHHQTNWELASAIAALLAIGIGLAGEYVCILGTIKASRDEKLESDARLTEALNRAATAEQALVDFRRPRRHLMTAENRALLISRLSQFARTEFDTGLSPGGEPMHFLWDLEQTLTNAGWHQSPWGVAGVGFPVVHRKDRPLSGSVNAETSKYI
jgi:hypothetical protein